MRPKHWPMFLLSFVASVAASWAQDPPLAEANRAAGVLVMERLKVQDPKAFECVRRCPEQAILLVDGRHDHTDRVLASLGLPFRRCSDRAFAGHSLHGVRLLIIDCPGEIGTAGSARVHDFVTRGGALLTTDWAVLHVLEEAFPEKVRWNRRSTRDDVVRISEAADDPLLRSMFPRSRLAAWWIENLSHPIQILSRDVRILLASEEMRSRYSDGALAVTFTAGRGRIVHVVSHTYLQRNHYEHPWESRTALDEAEACGLPTGSEGFRKLKDDGTLGRLKAGDLNAATSAQQFLVNVLLGALQADEPAVEPVPRPPDPLPPPRPGPPAPRPAPESVAEAARETSLRALPGGETTLRVVSGLRLSVVRREGGWALVVTPAGQQGWIAEQDLRKP